MSEYTMIRNCIQKEAKDVKEIMEKTGLKMGKIMKIIHCSHKKHFHVCEQGKVHLKKQKK